MRKRVLKWILGGIVAAVVIIGLTFAAFGFIVGRVPEYHVQLQDWLNSRTGLTIEFRTLAARLRLYGPELVFNDAVVRTPDRMRVLATARRGSVGFDLWRSIATGRLTAGRFALESPEIGLIRTEEGRIQLLGQSALPERTDAKPFAIEQLPTGRFQVYNAVVSFRDEITGRGPWSLSGISFDLTRDTNSLQLQGEASLPKALGRRLTFGGTVEGALERSAALVSTFRMEGEKLDLAGWADVLPDEWPAPETGQGSLRISGVLRGSALTQLSADVDFASVATALPAWTTPLPAAAPMERPGENDANAGDTPHEDQEPDSAAPLAITAEVASASQAEEQQAQEQTDETSDRNSPPDVPLPEMMSYSRIAFALRAQKRENEWDVSVSDLELTRPEASWRTKQLEARWSRSEDGGTKASGHSDRVVLEGLWPLLAYLPESEQLARLRALRATGTIQDLSFEYVRDTAAAAPKYSARAQLENVSFKPIERAPGLAGLGGTLRLTDQGGQWQLAATGAQFELPRIFRQPLVAESMEGTLSWRRTDSGWTIESEEIRLHNDDGRAVARFTATLPGDGSSPVLDLTAQGEDLNVGATSKYMPAGRLRPRTMEWFDRAFVDGRVVTAELIYQGPTRSFPFRKAEGTFLVRGHVENALFDYQPGWLPASGAAADIEFRNQGMRIRSTGATVGGVSINKASAEIADFKQARLVIDASVRADLTDGLAFLKQSPLAPKLGEPFARLSGQGPIAADVHLDLPIKRLADREIEVTTRFADATVSMQNVNGPVTQLTGALTVRNTLVASADMRGQWLGGPLEVSVEPRGQSASLLNAHGQADATQLDALLGLPEPVKLSGATDWSVSTAFASDRTDQEDRTVRIESTLEGLGIELPEPLGKRADESRPLLLTLQLDGDDTLLARGSLGNLRSLVRVRRASDAWTLDRGGIRADGIAPALPSHRGLRIEGAIDRFALGEWLALKGSDGGGKPLSEFLQAANVSIGTFEFAGYRWPDVRGILQATQAGWRVDVSGPNAAGQILIPESFHGAQPLRATLERLVLDKAPENGAPADTARDPRDLPNLQVYVADLRLGARAIGAVDMKATRVSQGIRFDTMSVNGESARAQGSGEWLTIDGGQRSSLQASITSSDVAATLRALNYGEFIAAKHGEIKGDLTWPGGFDDNILEHASGAISVYAEAGQLAAVQPGAGRVLGLFSVAALPRRLALDFSDLTDKGLAFDSVHGDFELRDGNAYTNNLLLRGPAAEIGIAGRTGLRTRDYDQTAVVTGNLGASLPVAGALAGGPAVGAALLLFSQMFKEPLKGITRGYYRITGSWDDPAVERVDASVIKVSEEKTPGAGEE